MPKLVPLFTLVAFATFSLNASLSAQTRGTVSSSALDAMVAARPADSRAVVKGALSSSQAVAVAGKMGLSSSDVAARVAVLDDATAQQLADRILAGGSSTVVISTTAIIIVLLILILLTH